MARVVALGGGVGRPRCGRLQGGSVLHLGTPGFIDRGSQRQHLKCELMGNGLADPGHSGEEPGREGSGLVTCLGTGRSLQATGSPARSTEIMLSLVHTLSVSTKV